MKKIIKGLISILAGCMIFSAAVFADGDVAILETHTGDTDISVYVKGASDSTEGIGVQIGTAEVSAFTATKLSDMDSPMKTLIMLDNSISIPEADREKISQLLQNMISDMGNEEISLATFSEDTNIVADYSSDYKTLKQAVDGIEYQDQETYLTDVLYDLISAQYIQNDEDVYRRIIVISDGVDNKSLGYTKEELSTLLKDNPVPIYTIGCVNRNNNEQLENMFAISRQTGVDYFIIDEVEDMFEISDTFAADKDMIKLTVTPPEEMLDGSKKAVKITFSDGASLTADVAMPQQVYVEPSIETEVEEETEEETETETETETEPETVEEEGITILGMNLITFLTIVIGVMAVIVIICIIVIMVRKKKNRQQPFETIDSSILNQMQNSDVISSDRTLMIYDSFQNGGANHEGTVMLWNQSTTYQVILTDINSPAKSFRVPLNQAIVIGRKADVCDIAIDYEKSISSKHCEISVSGGKFYVTDLQSSNGTFLNGSRVLTKTEIFSGNTLKLGRLELRFEVR